MNRVKFFQWQNITLKHLLFLFIPGILVGGGAVLLSPEWILVIGGGLVGTTIAVWLSCKTPEIFLILALGTNFLTGLFIPGITVGEFGLTPYMLFTVLAVGGYGFQILTGERRLIKPVGYIFLLLFIGITTLSLLIVQDFRAAIGVYARTALQWALFFLLVQMLVDQKSASRLIRILLIQAVIVVGWGIISGVQLNYFGVIERESFFWTQFQKNDFATYLAVVLTLALATLMVKTKRIDKLMALTLIPMLPIAWMFTFSRGGFLSILTSLSVFMFFIRSKAILQRLWLWSVVFIFLGIMGITLLPSNARNLAIDGLISIVNPEGAKIERNKKTVNIRFVVGKAALEVVAEKPILGVGFNQWQFYSPIQVRRYEAQTGEYVKSGFSIHNRYLGIATNSGLIALLFYLLFLFTVFFYGIKMNFSSRDQFLKVYLTAFLAALVGIQFSLQLTPVILWEWPVLGIVVGFINIIELEMNGALPKNKWVKFKTITYKSSALNKEY